MTRQNKKFLTLKIILFYGASKPTDCLPGTCSAPPKHPADTYPEDSADRETAAAAFERCTPAVVAGTSSCRSPSRVLSRRACGARQSLTIAVILGSFVACVVNRLRLIPAGLAIIRLRTSRLQILAGRCAGLLIPCRLNTLVFRGRAGMVRISTSELATVRIRRQAKPRVRTLRPHTYRKRT